MKRKRILQMKVFDLGTLGDELEDGEVRHQRCWTLRSDLKNSFTLRTLGVCE